ncbi:hypothetical protein LINPERPRIM_LOCUS33200 [Linum perenne]
MIYYFNFLFPFFGLTGGINTGLIDQFSWFDLVNAGLTCCPKIVGRFLSSDRLTVRPV